METLKGVAPGLIQPRKSTEGFVLPGLFLTPSKSAEIRNPFVNESDDGKSLEVFCEEVNGDVNSILGLYRKKDKGIEPARYFLTPNSSENHSELIEQEIILGAVPDGADALILMADREGDKRPTLISIAGYGIPPHRMGWAYRYELGKIEFPDDSLVIVQLQGPLAIYRKKGKAFAYETHNTFNCMQFMATMLVQWSKHIRMKNVYIVPAELNHYREKRIAGLQDRLINHYDIVAKQCGFIEDPKTGLFLLGNPQETTASQEYTYKSPKLH